MAKKASYNYTEQFFKDRGYVKAADGSWTPPKLKSKYIESLKEHLIVKEKVIETTNFTIKPVTEWFIPYNVPSKKNSRINFVRNGKQLSLPSKKHAEYVKLTERYYDVFGIEFRNTVAKLNIQKPYKIAFEFTRNSHHSFDYCNACQTCEDLMKDQYKNKSLVRKGWFEDDSAEFLIPVFKPYRYDKKNPGVKIRLIVD